jgi:hypothetical protein
MHSWDDAGTVAANHSHNLCRKQSYAGWGIYGSQVYPIRFWAFGKEQGDRPC